MRRVTLTVLSLITAAGLLTACGDDSGGDDPAGDPTTAAEQTTSEAATTDPPTSETADDPEPQTTDPDDPEGDLPDFAGTGDQKGDNSGKQDLVLTDVRVGEHEGFSRLVMEFSGTGVPGWSVSYVDKARLEGSGETVALDGDSYLDIYASGTTYPESQADYYDGPQQFDPEDGGDIEDVYVAGTFEGYTQVLAGLDGSESALRVYALTKPSRLVVDIADEED